MQLRLHDQARDVLQVIDVENNKYMKALRFWIEIAKHVLNAWDTVSADMGYSPFANKQAKTSPKPTVKE